MPEKVSEDCHKGVLISHPHCCHGGIGDLSASGPEFSFLLQINLATVSRVTV